MYIITKMRSKNNQAYTSMPTMFLCDMIMIPDFMTKPCRPFILGWTLMGLTQVEEGNVWNFIIFSEEGLIRCTQTDGDLPAELQSAQTSFPGLSFPLDMRNILKVSWMVRKIWWSDAKYIRMTNPEHKHGRQWSYTLLINLRIVLRQSKIEWNNAQKIRNKTWILDKNLLMRAYRVNFELMHVWLKIRV